jgi:PLP dependent protein
VAQPVAGLTAGRVAANLRAVREEIAAAARTAGRSGDEVELLAAVKYVAAEDLGALADAGLTTVGENRAQELERKAAAWPGVFTWDFIGRLQSRKVKVVAPLVRRIHSVASESAVRQLARARREGARAEAFVQVDIAGEDGKAGVRPADLAALAELAAEEGMGPITGLTVMPPLAASPEDSRRWFAAARDLAADHGLEQLSMGTTQDFAVAVEEGATIVRVGSRLFA